ncbi:MAG: hypothetical protein HGA45_34485, partial [Chloroflexales bacterium]|nr:hypothetical protein [Chloroflexales bacterium]
MKLIWPGSLLLVLLAVGLPMTVVTPPLAAAQDSTPRPTATVAPATPDVSMR